MRGRGKLGRIRGSEKRWRNGREVGKDEGEVGEAKGWGKGKFWRMRGNEGEVEKVREWGEGKVREDKGK